MTKAKNGITNPKPFVYLSELKEVCVKLQRSHNFTEFDVIHNQAIYSIFIAAGKIAKERGKK